MENETKEALDKAVNGLCAKLVFKKDGGLTWFGWLALAAATVLAGAMCSLFSGCVNVYTRSPFTEKRIEGVYQCTKEAAGISYIIMFPQMMNPSGGNGFMAANLISVPVGCIGMCDAAAEAVLDTVFLPADACLSKREK